MTLASSARASNQMQALMQVSLALTTERSLERVLQKIAEVARDVLRARYAAVGVIDERGTGLSQFLTAGIDEAGKAAIGPLPTGQGVLGLMIRERRPIRIRRLAAHPQSAGFPANHPAMESFLGVPIMVRDKAYGNLYVTEKQGGGEFSEADEQVALTLASQAGISIENALTFTFVRTPDYLKRRDQSGYSDVRAIALLDIDVAQVIVSKASGIKSVSELTEEQDGKPRYRVYVGLDQSGTRETADAILKAAMDANRYDRLFTQWAKASHKVNFNDAAQLLRDRQLDAAIFSTGLGAASAIKDLFEERPTDFQWLPLDQATQKELAQNGYDPMNVPGYTPEINVQTVGAPVLVATNRKTESWIVRDFVALLERHRSDLTPLLTPHPSRAPDSVPGLVTDPEQIKKLVAGEMPVHDGLQLGKWEVIGSWWLQGLGCLAMLMGQLGLLLVIRPVRASSDVAAQLGASGADGGAEALLHPTVQVANISGRWTFAGNAFVAVMGFLTALVSAVIHLLKP